MSLDTPGTTTILKPALPPASWACGVSRFEPNQPVATKGQRKAKIRFSPVYAGHKIKPLKKPAVSSQSACSLGQDRGHPASRKTPARIPAKVMSSLLPFEHLADVSK